MPDLTIHQHTLTRIAERLEKAAEFILQEARMLDARYKELASGEGPSFDYKEYTRVRAGDKLAGASALLEEAKKIREILL